MSRRAPRVRESLRTPCRCFRDFDGREARLEIARESQVDCLGRQTRLAFTGGPSPDRRSRLRRAARPSIAADGSLVDEASDLGGEIQIAVAGSLHAGETGSQAPAVPSVKGSPSATTRGPTPPMAGSHPRCFTSTRSKPITRRRPQIESARRLPRDWRLAQPSFPSTTPQLTQTPIDRP